MAANWRRLRLRHFRFHHHRIQRRGQSDARPLRHDRGERHLLDEWGHQRRLKDKEEILAAFLRERMSITEDMASNRRLIADIVRPARRKHRSGGA